LRVEAVLCTPLHYHLPQVLKALVEKDIMSAISAVWPAVRDGWPNKDERKQLKGRTADQLKAELIIQ
jgi:hypothetical protein